MFCSRNTNNHYKIMFYSRNTFRNFVEFGIFPNGKTLLFIYFVINHYKCKVKLTIHLWHKNIAFFLILSNYKKICMRLEIKYISLIILSEDPIPYEGGKSISGNYLRWAYEFIQWEVYSLMSVPNFWVERLY